MLKSVLWKWFEDVASLFCLSGAVKLLRCEGVRSLLLTNCDLLVFISPAVRSQGVTLTDLKEAEKNVGKAVDSPPRNVQSVSPIVTITPAERGESAVCLRELATNRTNRMTLSLFV